MSAAPATTCPAERLRWAGSELGLAALGLASAQPLFEPTTALSPRLEVLEDGPRRRRYRFPLPGTADARGNLTGRPGPLGTGWLWLTTFRGELAQLLRARFTPPRSASLAEREWNLLCHLRAHGVGTCEPLLVGARGDGLVSTRSFLLVRAPEGAFPFPRWLRTDGLGCERARGLEAVGRTLAALRRARVELPALVCEDLWITPGGGGGCEEEGAGIPRRNHLPGVTVAAVHGGRFRSGGRDAMDVHSARLAALLTPAERAAIEQLARG